VEGVVLSTEASSEPCLENVVSKINGLERSPCNLAALSLLLWGLFRKQNSHVHFATARKY
jgi:hypothetical protein